MLGFFLYDENVFDNIYLLLFQFQYFKVASELREKKQMSNTQLEGKFLRQPQVKCLPKWNLWNHRDSPLPPSQLHQEGAEITVERKKGIHAKI